MSTKPVVLVVDDEVSQRALLRAVLQDEGFQVYEAASGAEAVERATGSDVDLILLDLRMPGMDGLATLTQLYHLKPAVPVLMMTAYATVTTAVTAMKQGAIDYLVKPLDLEEVKAVIKRVLNHQELVNDSTAQRRKLELIMDKPIVTGESPAMAEVFRLLELAAPTDVTVLLTGESGTGKGLIAELIHTMSPRRAQPFIKVNCGVLTETLLESELFGIEKRVATGVDERIGKFEAAGQGSIFLDEVEEMPPKLQVKLLRVLQEKEFERVGGAKTIKADVRIVAATNRDPEEEVKQGKLRPDLYYRLNVMPIRIPPLRERQADIEPLALHFLAQFAAKMMKPIKGLAPSTLALLQYYDWPGNVRELMNVMERAVILTRYENLMPTDLPATIRNLPESHQRVETQQPITAIREVEKGLILKTLATTGGNRSETARLLGISRRTLQNKLKEYGVQ